MMNTYLEERLAEVRRKELMRQAEINRLLREAHQGNDKPAILGPLMSAILAVLAVAVVALTALV